MLKNMKSGWMVAALALGLGAGFTAGARTESRPQPTGNVECAYDFQCDSRCGGAGTGSCYYGRCYCRM